MNEMETYFQDEMAKKEIAESGEGEEAATQLKTQALQIKTQMEALKQQMSSSSGGANNLASYQKILELFNNARDLTSNMPMAKMLYVDFSLPVQNNNPVMVNKKFNAKEINPSLSDEIIYGYYTIHIERRGAAPKAPVASH